MENEEAKSVKGSVPVLQRLYARKTHRPIKREDFNGVAREMCDQIYEAMIQDGAHVCQVEIEVTALKPGELKENEH